MRLKNLDLIIALVVVAINVAWTLVPNRFILAGIIFALPLILFLPGYTFTQMLFRGRASEQQAQGASNSPSPQLELKIGHPIGRSDQLLLSFGLSVAIDVLVGFVLNIFPIGLQAFSWILSLGLVTTLCALCAAFLRRKDIPRIDRTTRVRITFQDCMLLGLALLVGATAIWLSLIRPLQPQSSFTQFWMLPANQTSKACMVSVGIQSFETTSETFQIIMTVNHVKTNTWSSIVLAPQQKWVQSIAVAPGTASSVYVEVQLYLANKPNKEYRNAYLTFYISSSNTNGLIHQQCVMGT